MNEAVEPSPTYRKLEAEVTRLRHENARLRHYLELAAFDSTRLIQTLQKLLAQVKKNRGQT